MFAQTNVTQSERFIPAFLTANTNAGTMVTALSVAGSGVVTGFNATSGVAGGTVLKVTIDGVVVMNDTSLVPINAVSVAIPCYWRFNRSLLVEFQSSGGNPLILKVAYMTA